MFIRQLVYISRSVKLMKSADLLPLLEQARKRNESRNITGMLLYKDRSFIQLLEGPDTVVEEVFSSISADCRHMKVKTIINMQVAERSFSKWSMGFHSLNENNIDLPAAYTDFMSIPISTSVVQIRLRRRSY